MAFFRLKVTRLLMTSAAVFTALAQDY